MRRAKQSFDAARHYIEGPHDLDTIEFCMQLRIAAAL